MTIDEAIKYCLEVAEGYEIRAKLGGELTSLFDCSQRAIEYRQLAEWLKELKEAKRLLKSATNVLNMFIPCDEDNNCSECIKQRQNCDYDDSFKWRYAAEALKLIGEDEDEN